MWMHADDAIDVMFGAMGLELLWKEEVHKMYPRKYYHSEISIMVSTWEYNESDFTNWYYNKSII